MLYRQRQEYRQPEVGALLIFDGAAYHNVVVALAPVRREALGETVDALCEKVEPAIGALPHHAPAVLPPWVGVLQQEIRRETGQNNPTRRYFVAAAAASLHRQVERRVFCAPAACGRIPVHFVLPVDVAEFAARTYFRAAVPGIPVCVYAVFHGGLIPSLLNDETPAKTGASLLCSDQRVKTH